MSGEVLATDERLRMLIETMPDPVFFKDGDGRWQVVNRAALDAFEVRGDYRGKTDCDLAKEADFYRDAFEYCADTDEAAWQQGSISRSDERLPRRDGTVHVYDTYKIPLFHPDGSRKGLIVLGRDVTDRQRAEDILRASEQQLRSILSTMLDAVFLVDGAGKLTFANPAAERLLGAASGDIVGRSWSQGPWSFLRRNGDGKLDRLEDCRSLVSGAEIVVVRADGSRVVASMNSAPLGEAGSGYVVAARDVTEGAELAALKTAFLQIAAHELRTPLTPLRLLLEQTARRAARGQPIPAHTVERMQRQAERLTTLVNELVELVRLEQGVLPVSPRAIDVEALVGAVVDGYREEVPDRTVRVGVKRPVIADVDPARIERVVDSLIDNAIKYSSGDVEIEVDGDGATVRVSVCDRGPGVAPKDEAFIFSRFYRAPAVETVRHGGLGLSLALSRETVRRHGGDLTYRRREGGGSVFSFTVPRAHEPALDRASAH
ncbi:MAG: PAS domain S-box protein [Deltaproteobacteria bacterium]|nr:PAS domain S-box protein [Deltaproteobacteria bacterium]